MMCPSCQVALNMSERQGIEIDYCPQCRGVWLDRGELDKIIERSLQAEEGAVRAEPARQQPVAEARYDRGHHEPGRDERRHSSERERHDGHKYRDDDYHRRRKKSFLSELLDF